VSSQLEFRLRAGALFAGLSEGVPKPTSQGFPTDEESNFGKDIKPTPRGEELPKAGKKKWR